MSLSRRDLLLTGGGTAAAAMIVGTGIITPGEAQQVPRTGGKFHALRRCGAPAKFPKSQSVTRERAHLDEERAGIGGLAERHS